MQMSKGNILKCVKPTNPLIVGVTSCQMLSKTSKNDEVRPPCKQVLWKIKEREKGEVKSMAKDKHLFI